MAPLEFRLSRITDMTAKQLQERDDEQVSFIQRVYGRSIDDPEGYDLMLNMESIDFGTGVDIVMAALRKKLQAAG
jgi:cytidylate kinase